MISRLGLWISRLFRGIVPDPFVLAILLTLLTAILALIWGDFGPDAPSSRVVALLDAWRADSGLWKFLTFGMQMCLILITGHALASTRPVRAAIDRLSELPGSTASAAALIAATACAAALLNWGLGLIVGALMAREVGRSLELRGVRAHYPLLCAAGYLGLLVWHGGLSGSAPLSMTTMAGAEKVLPEASITHLIASNAAAGLPAETGVSLGQTIFSPLNLIVSGGLLLGLPLLISLMAPKNDDDIETIAGFDVELDRRQRDTSRTMHLPDRLDRSMVIAWLLALPMFAAVARYVVANGIGSLDLNTINLAMLALGLALHGSPVAYMDAVTDGARGCSGIMIQFPLYAGIMAMMVEANLIGIIAEKFVAIGGDRTLPMLSFLSAAIVNLFVPSGGGQWGIQGPLALEIAERVPGLSTGKMIMAVCYGDQLTNMLQPFWALPLLAITGVRARDIVGYTALVMIVAAVWMALCLLVL